MVNEDIKILEEGKAIRASDIDWIRENGYGWPVYRGGPMWWGDQVGLGKVLEKMRKWEGLWGRFTGQWGRGGEGLHALSWTPRHLKCEQMPLDRSEMKKP